MSKHWEAILKLLIRNKTDRDKAVEEVSRINTVKLVTITHPTRGTSQNAAYWGVVLKSLSEQTGNDEDGLHEFFKKRFLRPKECLVMGEEVTYTPSTTKLTTKAFGEYLDKIYAFCAEQGYPLPTIGEEQ